MRTNRTIRVLLLFCLILAMAAGTPGRMSARGDAAEKKVVRVGWFDSTFCYWDQFGRRCGIDYEYQQKISAYTGWTYEYVEDSWSNLLQMLMRGEIDLLSDVSYKEERTEYLAYPDLPMGTESYYIYIDMKNREITADNLASFNGKRIGVSTGSIQEDFLQEWAERNHISIEIEPLTTEEDDSMNLLTHGKIDGYASIYTFSSEQNAVPICRIGGSDYFYAVNKGRPDLLAELNMALSGIHDEDPYFIERLSDERQYNTKTNVLLTPNQEDWIREHGIIRVGYLEDYMPFCQADPATGELTGALKDFLIHTENNIGIKEIKFETKAYATVGAALEALKSGEADCVFPVCLNSYDANTAGVRLTNKAMKTGMNTVLPETETQTLSRDSEMTIALVAGDPNTDTFVMEHYPNCRRLTFPSEKECYDAVTSGMANCTLVSNYRTPEMEDTFKKYKLYSVPTGEHIPFSFAVKTEDRELYFLLNKAVTLSQSEEMDSALASYMRGHQKVSFQQFMEDNWIWVLLAVLAVSAVIIVLLVQRLRATRRANEQERLLEEAAEIAELKQAITSLLDNMPGMNYTKDAKTGVYLACNQAFARYARRKNPDDVIGHTDAELFDEETAARQAEDDRMAISMNVPYIFFEDVPNAAGNVRQIKTTKLKYTDDTGRLCVLGSSQDVTDTVRIQRESVTSKESYEQARSTGIIYAHIAQALARGYSDLYYIDLNTEEFIEYHVDAESGGLTEARRGWHFFEEHQEEIERDVYPEDQENVKKALERRTLTAALEKDNTFLTTYRLNRNEGPRFVNIKVTRMQDDDSTIILGVMDIDEQVKQRTAALRAKEEQIAYNRLSALAGDYMCIYVVDPETGRYREFSSTEGYKTAFAQAKEGQDFFEATRAAAREFTHPEDLNRFLSVFTKENVLADIERHGIFTISYRLMIDGKPRYVQLKANLIQEENGQRLIAGINDIDVQVRQEESYVRHLARARIEANVDPLTRVKNRNAYLVAEERLNAQMGEDPGMKFAIIILDVNDLKDINDRDGHSAGDQYLQEACKIICKIFKHSPVFRVGGDEFAVISQGDDYEHMDELIRQMAEQNEDALRTGGIVIACGMARRENDKSVASVFERADRMMYENKSDLKERKKG